MINLTRVILEVMPNWRLTFTTQIITNIKLRFPTNKIYYLSWLSKQTTFYAYRPNNIVKIQNVSKIVAKLWLLCPHRICLYGWCLVRFCSLRLWAENTTHTLSYWWDRNSNQYFDYKTTWLETRIYYLINKNVDL